jgi:hypothetical protein
VLQVLLEQLVQQVLLVLLVPQVQLVPQELQVQWARQVLLAHQTLQWYLWVPIKMTRNWSNN